MTESLVDVALLAYGGPQSPQQVVPFLERLMGRTPEPGTIAVVQERYALIGGNRQMVGDQMELLAGHGENRAGVDCHLTLCFIPQGSVA